MLGAMAAPKIEQRGNIRFHAVKPGVIESVYNGYLTLGIAEETFPAFEALLSGATTTHWIANTIALEGFENGVLVSGRYWLQAFKAHGGKVMILVSESASTRMAALAIGFAVGVTLKVVSARAEALALLPAG